MKKKLLNSDSQQFWIYLKKIKINNNQLSTFHVK
jgi:hypothetical protein